MKNINNKLITTIVFMSFIGLSGITHAQPAGQDQIRILTSAPKRTGQTAFSNLIGWRKGVSYEGRANGLTFINGSDEKKPMSDKEVAHRIVVSSKGAMSYEAPADRGAKVEQVDGKAEILISSKEGFDFTHTTFRDYSNQKLSYNIPGKSFQSVNVGISINLVYSAIVEFVMATTTNKTTKASGGWVKVLIDNDPLIEIKTDGKTTEQIEKELASELKGKGIFSKSSIYPNHVESSSRNYKPFDGGEVQLLRLSANSITIDVNDPSLGVITKFDFPDVNKPVDVASRMPYIIGFTVLAVIAGLVFLNRRKSSDEEDASV